jgi:hypothetical protein
MPFLPRSTFAKENDVGEDRRAFVFEGIRRRADRPQEIRSLGQILAGRGVLLLERVMAGDQGEHFARGTATGVGIEATEQNHQDFGGGSLSHFI